MDIHVVRPGDTVYQIAQEYGVSMARLLEDNQLSDPSRLVVGQTLVVRYPCSSHRVKAGETLFSIARAAGISIRQLLRNNPGLQGEDLIFPGQELTLSFCQPRQGALSVTGYAYPDISPGLLQQALPYLSDLAIFTCRITAQGELIPPSDQAMRSAARAMGVAPVLHVSNLADDWSFSGPLAHAVLQDRQAGDRLIGQILDEATRRGCRGVDLDFEGVYPGDAQAYARLAARLREGLAPLGLPLFVALVAKTRGDQPGAHYQGHQYKALGEAADALLLMTYEWGYSGGPPMAVAPLPEVRRVIEYALTEIPAEKLWLGVPTYGYDWTLPYAPGGQRARSLSCPQAVELAARHFAAIRFDSKAQAPWFRYVDPQGAQHEVWFEDARSIRAKLELAGEYGLYGVGYWNLMRPFPQNWAVLDALYEIRDGDMGLL